MSYTSWARQWRPYSIDALHARAYHEDLEEKKNKRKTKAKIDGNQQFGRRTL